MKDDIELLLRARDYCDMVVDEIDNLDQGDAEIEVRKKLVSACMTIEEAIKLINAVK